MQGYIVRDGRVNGKESDRADGWNGRNQARLAIETALTSPGYLADFERRQLRLIRARKRAFQNSGR
jgi:hypothetical protein